MTTKIDNSLYIKISKFALDCPDGFSYPELKEGISVTDDSWEDKIIRSYIDNALHSGIPGLLRPGEMSPSLDSLFFVLEIKGNYSENRFILKYDAYFNYIDYLEYREALKSSESAKHIAYWSIGISIVLALVSVYIQAFGSVTLDSNQLDKIITQIETVNNHK